MRDVYFVFHQTGSWSSKGDVFEDPWIEPGTADLQQRLLIATMSERRRATVAADNAMQQSTGSARSSSALARPTAASERRAAGSATPPESAATVWAADVAGVAAAGGAMASRMRNMPRQRASGSPAQGNRSGRPQQRVAKPHQSGALAGATAGPDGPDACAGDGVSTLSESTPWSFTSAVTIAAQPLAAPLPLTTATRASPPVQAVASSGSPQESERLKELVVSLQRQLEVVQEKTDSIDQMRDQMQFMQQNWSHLASGKSSTAGGAGGTATPGSAGNSAGGEQQVDPAVPEHSPIQAAHTSPCASPALVAPALVGADCFVNGLGDNTPTAPPSARPATVLSALPPVIPAMPAIQASCYLPDFESHGGSHGAGSHRSYARSQLPGAASPGAGSPGVRGPLPGPFLIAPSVGSSLVATSVAAEATPWVAISSNPLVAAPVSAALIRRAPTPVTWPPVSPLSTQRQLGPPAVGTATRVVPPPGSSLGAVPGTASARGSTPIDSPTTGAGSVFATDSSGAALRRQLSGERGRASPSYSPGSRTRYVNADASIASSIQGVRRPSPATPHLPGRLAGPASPSPQTRSPFQTFRALSPAGSVFMSSSSLPTSARQQVVPPSASIGSSGSYIATPPSSSMGATMMAHQATARESPGRLSPHVAAWPTSPGRHTPHLISTSSTLLKPRGETPRRG